MSEDYIKADNAPEIFETPYIVAAVIFYRQTDERLNRLVASLEGRVDALVALDGPYAGLSDELSSPDSNYNTLADAAQDIGIPWWVYEGQFYGSEPAKRTAAARAALSMARVENPDPDVEPWVLVIDSDEWLMTDIDPDLVKQYGYGSCKMQSWREGKGEVNEGGSGSRMARLFPNSEDLIWGPAHFDVRDMSVPVTYSGWEKALVNDNEPAFILGHDLGDKVIQAEYESYNDVRRVEHEGKMMRIVDDYQRGGDRVVIRMDNEQIVVGKWAPGTLISIGGPLLNQEENGHVAVREIVPVKGHENLISDIVCERVDEAEAERLGKIRYEAELEQEALKSQLLAKRLQKRARQHDRQRRRYG